MTEEPGRSAVFPSVARAAGLYESFYVKASAPAGRRALWLRHTVHKRPGEAPVGSVWCTVFSEGTTAAAKVTEPGPRAGGTELVRVGESAIELGGARGRIGDRGSWSLRFESDEPLFEYLPARWLYRVPLPRTKAVSLRPTMRVHGELVLDGRRLELDGWPGMLGHNWGSEHAERWVWLHAAGFAGRPDAWLDVVVGRVRAGGRVLPWIASGGLSIDGRRIRLGGPARLRSTRIDAAPTQCEFELPGAGGLVIRGNVRARTREDVVVWRYADPAGSEHHTAHCSIADLELRVPETRRGGPEAPANVLRCEDAAAYELGMHPGDHDLPVEPYPDP